MDPTDLRPWERSALPPSSAAVPARRRRPPRRPPHEAHVLALLRARRIRDRARAATAHGLVFTLLLGTPLGWSLASSSLRGMDGSPPVECPSVASFLPAALQQQLRRQEVRGGLSGPERGTLGMKVCDPAVRGVLQPLLGGISDLESLKGMAERVSGAGDFEPLPVIRSLLAGQTGD